MRFWSVLLAGCAACSFEKSVGPLDASPMFDDAGREIRAWRFDTAGEFSAVGARTIDMTIDPVGALTPEGYIYGALLARGVQGTKLWSNTDADWSKISTVTPAGYGLWSGNDLSVGARDLAFVGISSTPMVSLWFEGEIWFNPGETVDLAGNDTAFLYVALDGTLFEKIVQNSAAAIAVPAAGWYPVRLGWADGDNSGDLDFEINGSTIEHTRFRATTSALRGLYRSVYYREVHGGGIGGKPPVTSIQETPVHATTAFNPPLPGSVTTTTTPFDWSARWTGQFYALAGGSYTFRIDSDDGSRMLLGNQLVTQNFTRGAKGAVMTSVTAELVAGWNDLVIDYNHVDGPPSFALTVVNAPPADAALMGAPVPLARLRPIEPRVDRLITRSNVPDNAVTIQDDQAGTFAELTARIDAHPGELVASIAITARVTTPNPQQLVFRLVAPNNAQQVRTMTIVPDPNGNGSMIAAAVFDLGAGQAANGSWRFGISDVSGSGGGGNSQYHELHMTVHTTGGREQIAPAATWRSPIVENQTDVVLVDFVNITKREPAGSSTIVRMRTCALADCSDGVFSEPIAPGAAPVLPPNRYIQTQVELTSNGTQEPEVDKLEMQYRTAPR